MEVDPSQRYAASFSSLLNEYNTEMPLCIALLSQTSYPSKKAGTEVYVHELASKLAAYGHSVCVLSLESANLASVDSICTDVAIPYQLLYLENVKNVLPVLFEIKPDVVHFHTLNTGGFSLDTLDEVQKAGFPTLVTFHLANTTCLSNDLWAFRTSRCVGTMDHGTCTQCVLSKRRDLAFDYRLIYRTQRVLLRMLGGYSMRIPGMTLAKVSEHHAKARRVLSRCERLICLADWYADVLAANGFSQELILRLPQIASTAPLKGKRTLRDRRSVVFVGRICGEKGAPDLLNAWEAASTENLSLVLFGKLEDTSEFSDLFGRYLVKNENISYRGELPHPTLLVELSRHDVLVLPSLFSEMSPLVVSEAFAGGLSVIGSDAPGVKEACGYGNHVLYERGDVDALARLFSLLNAGKLEFDSAKLPRVDFSSLENAERHISIYHDVQERVSGEEGGAHGFIFNDSKNV
jgi:glycosyltransferase involved in cell wall biosynthesis